MVRPERSAVEVGDGSIAILRALQLGDLLCAVPAWRALRAAQPMARIAIVGLPWAREFVSRFHRYLDEFIEFPGYPGLPEREPAVDRIPDFLNGLQRRRFDAFLQMQGSGHYANEIAVLSGARILAGYYSAPEFCPDPRFFLPYPEGIPEVRRHLRLMEFLGIPGAGDQLEFPLTDDDEAEFGRLGEAAALEPGSYVCLHPGGRRPTNRWTPDRFAQVADRLSGHGLIVVLTGTCAEIELGEAVQRRMQGRAINLVGRTTLGALGVLLSRARLLVSNDTGVSHLAAALSIPSVIVCIGSDPVRWGPLDRLRHRVVAGSDAEADSVLREAEPLLRPTPVIPHVPFVTDGLRDHRPRRLRILTWHVHGNYLYYLSHVPHEFYLPVGRSAPGYAGAAPGLPWPDNVHEVPVADVPREEFDCILFQSKEHYLIDQYEILTDRQRALPRLYLEHDPPREHPTDTVHPVDDPTMLLIHVTHFNRLMWNGRRTPTRVIEHGVLVPGHCSYTGEREKGLVIVNHLQRRGRRLGADLVEYVRARVPLDVAGMESTRAGGLGEVAHDRLPELMCRYRFVFHPARYTSLGLALCEAMALGVPPVALATTEVTTVIRHDVSGYVDTDVDALIRWMTYLLSYPEEARRIGAGAKEAAQARFGIDRFVRDWDATLRGFVAERRGAARPTPAAAHTGAPR